MPYTIEDLDRVDEQISELKKLRKLIAKDLNARDRLRLTGDLLKLYNFIEAHPGCCRQTIMAGLPELTDKDYNNLMNRLVRNRGIAGNHGSRSQPQWFAK